MTDADARAALPPPWRKIAPPGQLRVTRLAAGELLFRQGQRSRGAFFTASGRIALIRTLADGARLTLFTANAGETFAEASLFSTSYHCEAVAQLPSVVVEIPKAAVARELAHDPRAGAELARVLAAQVRDLRARLELRNIKSARERVLAWLHHCAAGDPPIAEARPSWKAVATEIGLSHEALYRALRALEASGAIRRDGRRCRVH